MNKTRAFQVLTLSWLITLNENSTPDNKRRTFPCSNLCLIYGLMEESVDQLFVAFWIILSGILLAPFHYQLIFPSSFKGRLPFTYGMGKWVTYANVQNVKHITIFVKIIIFQLSK